MTKFAYVSNDYAEKNVWFFKIIAIFRVVILKWYQFPAPRKYTTAMPKTQAINTFILTKL